MNLPTILNRLRKLGYRPLKRPDNWWDNSKTAHRLGYLQGDNEDIFSLSENEFRYWAQNANLKSFFAKCRRCSQVIFAKAGIETHQKLRGCTRVLTMAYQLLGRDAKCVMCDGKTEKKHWGIPLCSDECIVKWRTALCPPKALTLAINLVEASDSNRVVQ